MAIACEGGLGLLGLALGCFLERPIWSQIQWTATAVAEGLLATAPLLAGLVVVTRYPSGPLKALNSIAHEVIVPIFRSCAFFELLLISFLAGFGEEILFRGAIQAGVQQVSGSHRVALVIASLLFGLVHPITATYAVLAGTIGIYLGGLWLATGNLLVPIVTHAAYDFVALKYLLSQHSATGNKDAADAGRDMSGHA